MSDWSSLGIVAALLIGYVVGDSGRDDDVNAASAEAAQAQQEADAAKKQAAAAEQALKDDQAQDEEAVQGSARAWRTSAPRSSSRYAGRPGGQDAVDQAANDISAASTSSVPTPP